MDCITQNHQPVVINKPQPRGLSIPQKWLVVVHLHLAGRKVKQIAHATGYTENSVYRILNHEDVNLVRQQLLDTTQKEFEALFPAVVDAIQTGLQDPDPKTQALFTAQWLKAHGKFNNSAGTNIQVNVTAEDVVANILNAPEAQAQAQAIKPPLAPAEQQE